MKIKLLLFFAVFQLAGHAAEFPLKDFQLRLVNRSGVVISHILSGNSHIVHRTEKMSEQTWASDRFSVSCRITKNFTSGYRMQWQIKALNGIPEGAFLGLFCRIPNDWRMQKSGKIGAFLLITPKQTWQCFVEGALVPQIIQRGQPTTLCWYWNYDPENINIIDFILTMTPGKIAPTLHP